MYRQKRTFVVTSTRSLKATQPIVCWPAGLWRHRPGSGRSQAESKSSTGSPTLWKHVWYEERGLDRMSECFFLPPRLTDCARAEMPCECLRCILKHQSPMLLPPGGYKAWRCGKITAEKANVLSRALTSPKRLFSPVMMKCFSSTALTLVDSSSSSLKTQKYCVTSMWLSSKNKHWLEKSTFSKFFSLSKPTFQQTNFDHCFYFIG